MNEYSSTGQGRQMPSKRPQTQESGYPPTKRQREADVPRSPALHGTPSNDGNGVTEPDIHLTQERANIDFMEIDGVPIARSPWNEPTDLSLLRSSDSRWGHQIPTQLNAAHLEKPLTATDDDLNAWSHVFEPDPSGGKETVCFGMISGISAEYEQRNQAMPTASFHVRLESSDRFTSVDSASGKGRIHDEHGNMLEGLLDEQSLDLQVSCIIDQQYTAKRKGRSNRAVPCTLQINVHGPFELFDEIGDWFQQYDVYLQDPEFWYLDSRYCNPHKMSASDPSNYTCPMVSEVVSKSLVLTTKELPELTDFLDILSSQVELEETPQPSAISAVLKKHQKQALTFMLKREEGWGFDNRNPDIWEMIDTHRGRMFLNTVTRVCQTQEPPQFSGGVIADPMGLGKTLTMISLVAADMETDRDLSGILEDPHTDKLDVAATLVIIPPPILGTWEQQINDHTVGGDMIFRRHHGKTKISGIEELSMVNIVLTTYHTVAAEWKTNQSTRKSPLFSVRWRRIILDEAHFVRNANAIMAGAVCGLEAMSRWAVTGTPIQNRLGDLASLLKFIRVYPYAEPKRFEADISRLWKSGEGEEAVRRLKRLSTCLLLRRAKATISLPPRKDLVYEVDFTPEEKIVYERIRQQTIARIDECLEDELGAPRSHGYANVLHQIESLRLFSNLGLFYDSRHEKASQSQSSEGETWEKLAQRTFNSQRDLSSISCLQCTSALGLSETLLDDTNPSEPTAQYTSCLKYICSDCVDRIAHGSTPVPCGHTPPCQAAPVSTSRVALEEVDSVAAPQLRMASITPPSKIKRLIMDIKSIDPGVKCLVFSTWRLTLDLIKAGLEHESIKSIRFDGEVPQKDRQSVVERFTSDPSIRVMLLTLSCGAVGLTLTAASRAYLMEPHWNPTLEEQALARIHRLGQTKEVTTVRLVMRDSFEQQVVKVQDSKKQLAGVLLSPNDSEYTDSKAEVLERLRMLL